MNRPISPITVRRSVVTLLGVALALVATASSASAEVVDSGHTVTTNVVVNACDPADGLITITTDSHWETRLQPDGTLVSHFVNHSEGMSANGTKYIANRQATTVTPASSTTAQVEVEIRRISAGPGDNVVISITGTFPGTLTTTVSCTG